MYDSYLNHMTQPDSIIPNMADPQSLNRYSYVRNNPINFSDPTGHCTTYINGNQCVDNGGLSTVTQSNNVPSWNELDRFGITLSGNWTSDHMFAVWVAAMRVGNKLAQKNGGTVVSAFREKYSGGVNITFGTYNPKTDLYGKPTGYDYNHPDMSLKACAGVKIAGCTSSPTQIDFWSMAGDNDSYGNEISNDIYNVVHELGHAYGYGNGMLSTRPGGSLSRDALRPPPFQMHPPSMNIGGVDDPGELYADTFVAWTFNAWSTDPFNQGAVDKAQLFMP